MVAQYYSTSGSRCLVFSDSGSWTLSVPIFEVYFFMVDGNVIRLFLYYRSLLAGAEMRARKSEVSEGVHEFLTARDCHYIIQAAATV